MKRREFMSLLGGVAASWPFAARAQQSTMPVVGFLGTGGPADWADFVSAFHRGLAENSFEVGRNVVLEFRWAEGQASRLPALAAELAARPVSLIVSSAGTEAARAAKASTTSTPLVFVMGGDPVKFDLVGSINRPGGNATGVSFLLNILAAKRIELLHTMVPSAARIGLLVNPSNPNAEADTRDAEAAAGALGRETHVVHVRRESDLEPAFDALAEKRVGALFIASDVLFLSRREQVVALAARRAIPTNYDRREFTVAGGLFSYGTNFLEAHRLAGNYAGRILKGEKPGDLPVIQPTKFDLVINLKTAMALGIQVPPSLLALADEVIE